MKTCQLCGADYAPRATHPYSHTDMPLSEEAKRFCPECRRVKSDIIADRVYDAFGPGGSAREPE